MQQFGRHVLRVESFRLTFMHSSSWHN